MGRQQDQQQSDPVVAAIERVLNAERDGVEQLRQAQEHAQQLLAEARAQASAIARRADGCITKLHTAYLQKVQRDIQKLAPSKPSPGERAGNGYDRAALAAAAHRVAAKLSGGA